jgi:hypothetical protein
MEGLTQIARKRAERAKDHRYTTPLPFDTLASRPGPVSIVSERRAPAIVNSYDSDVHRHLGANGGSSSPSQNLSERKMPSGESSANTQRHTSASKHIPLHTLIDFRASHSRQPGIRTSEDVSRSAAYQRPRPQHQGHPEPPTERITHDGVPHLMTRDSTVMVESVDGVPLTATWNSSSNPGNALTIPEMEAEVIRTIERPTEADDLNLDAEFQHYQRLYARSSPTVWGGGRHGGRDAPMRIGQAGEDGSEQALWTKLAWEKRTKQTSSRPAHRAAEQISVDKYSTAAPTTEHVNHGGQREQWTSPYHPRSLHHPTASSYSETSAAPAPVIPLQRK